MVYMLASRKAPHEPITGSAKELLDMRPGLIIKNLDLLRPIYRKTACYGHFGREDPDFTREKTDRAEELRRKLTG